MEPSDRKLTPLARYAFHEAGHAVVARLLGFPVPLVWAWPELGGACITPGGCVGPGASRAAKLVPHRWYRLGRRRAERMVAARLPRLRAVAAALVNEGTLCGGRVEQAMQEP